MRAGACCVGMRTRVWGSGGSASSFLSASSSSLGLGNLAVQIRRMLGLVKSEGRHLLDAMLIARSTLCQLDNTAATAVRATRQHRLGWHIAPPSRTATPAHGLWGKDVPSVPSERVWSFSASICIWSARPALSACRSLRFESSAFFSAMRASSTGDWPDGCEPPRELEGLRKWDARGRVG